MSEYIYNFSIHQFEPKTEAITDWSKYVGEQLAMNLYQVYVDMGINPIEAAKLVLEAQLGIES